MFKKLSLVLAHSICLALVIYCLELTLQLIPAPVDKNSEMADQNIASAWEKDRQQHGHGTWPIIDQDATIPPKSNKTRILIVGDSLVHGNVYPNQNHVWPEALKNQLLAAGYDVEVYRAGTFGLSTYDEYLALVQTELLDLLSPDLVIMGFYVNDLEPRSVVEHNGYDVAWLTDDIFAYTGANAFTIFLKKHLPILYAKVNTAIINKFSHHESWLDAYGYNWHRHYMNYTEKDLFLFENRAILPLKELLGTHRQTFFVTCDTDAWERRAFYQPMENFLTDLGLTYYNLIPDLATEMTFSHQPVDNEQMQTDFYVNPVDKHPGHRATQFCARKIQTILERDYPQLLPQSNNPINTKQIIINDYLPYQLNVTRLESGLYQFQYPSTDQETNFLYWPIGTPYIKLNFQFPIDLSEISITGNFKQATIWVNKLNHDKAYLDNDGKLAIWDDQKFYQLLEKSNLTTGSQTNKIFRVDDIDITSLNLNLEFSNHHDRTITIKLSQPESRNEEPPTQQR